MLCVEEARAHGLSGCFGKRARRCAQVAGIYDWRSGAGRGDLWRAGACRVYGFCAE